MPPAKKVHLDKAAWAWCDNVDIDPSQINEDNVKCSYRLNLIKCKFGTCRRNCRGNPYCLFGLGETRWLSDPSEDTNEDDNELEVRKPSTFVGLKNLGATCYVNSLLQLWFHNLAFRQAIFSWNPFEEPAEIAEIEGEKINLSSPKTVVGHLQLLFALMQFSKQKFIDPLAFIKALRLEPSTQQDAQEFSQLFISLLEDSLKQQSDPSVRNLINNNFRGEYSYITRCSKCQFESISPSFFCELELNVKGHKTLHESIKEFLKEEKLEGVNKYSCSQCLEKQEATRFISLNKLPAVLNLQLMRFIYDRQKRHKKKLNTCIQFPDTLDMSIYFNEPQNDSKPLKYNLTAVLIHKGPSAYSGHYIAHICDQTTGTWYKFNDENVEKMEGKKLILGPGDENEEGTKKTKQPRLAKGYLASSNAYMLVYTAASEQTNKYSFNLEDLQPHLIEQIKKSNDDFDALIAETKAEEKAKRVNGRVHRAEIAALFKSLPVNNIDEQEWEVIAASWLIHWLSNATSFVESIDNTKLLCPHNKLHPDQVPNAKYVSSESASKLYEKFSGGPRLIGNNALCKECVVRKWKSVRLRSKIAEDHKDISNLLKLKEERETNGFWIGKRSLKVWRRKALIKHLDREERLASDAVERGLKECFSDEVDLNSQGFDNEASPQYPPVEVTNGYCQSDKIQEHQEITTSATQQRNLLDSSSSSGSGGSCSAVDSITVTNSTDSVKPTALDLINSIDNQITQIKGKWADALNYNEITSEISDDFKNVYDTVDKLIYFYSKTTSTTANNIYSNNNSIKNEINNVDNLNSLNCENNTNTLDNCHSLKRKRCEVDTKELNDNCDDHTVGMTKSDEEEDDEEEFNEDIKCIHGKLTHEESRRRLISEHIWNKLKWYFPDSTEYPKDVQPCEICQRLAAFGQEALDQNKQQAQTQKDLLSSLLYGKCRPKLVSGTFHVISVEEFLKPWRKFIRESGRTEPLHSLRNTSLICLHGDLMYSLQMDQEPPTVAAVTEEEWNILTNVYIVDQDITVSYGPDGEVIQTNPKLCNECMLLRLENEHKALLQYDKAKLYIRQVSNKTPDESRARSPSPRLELNKNKNSNNTDVSGDAATNFASQSEATRRSTRQRRVRGAKEFTVSSNETLQDLKVKIFNVLCVAPYDQHISTEDGRMLVDQSATLASLNIFPNSVLLLRVDQPADDETSIPEDYIRTSEPEEGFKGTVLLKR